MRIKRCMNFMNNKYSQMKLVYVIARLLGIAIIVVMK